MLITDGFSLYLEEVILFRSQSEKTEEHHHVAMRSLIKHSGNIRIASLTFTDIRKWKSKLERENKSVQTIRGYLIKLRVVLAHLKNLGHDVLDPHTIQLPKRIERPPDYISKEEVTQLILSTSKPRNKAIIALLYSSGIRVSELTRMNRSDIKEKKFTVFGKGQKYRLAFLDDRALTYIQEYLYNRKDNNPELFEQRLTHTRLSSSGVQEILRYASKSSGIKATPHTLRHSYATNMMENGAHIYTIQRLLGHSSIQTTQKYLHVTDIRLQEEHARFHTI